MSARIMHKRDYIGLLAHKEFRVSVIKSLSDPKKKSKVQ